MLNERTWLPLGIPASFKQYYNDCIILPSRDLNKVPLARAYNEGKSNRAEDASCYFDLRPWRISDFQLIERSSPGRGTLFLTFSTPSEIPDLVFSISVDRRF
jgi:hypothetical protein